MKYAANTLAFQTAMNTIVEAKGLGSQIKVDGILGPNTCALARTIAQSVGVPGFVPAACPAGGVTPSPGGGGTMPDAYLLPSSTGPNWWLIGGGALAVGVVAYLMLKRRK
jgi:hypothetical protein